MNKYKSLSDIEKNEIDCIFFAIALVVLTQPVQAADPFFKNRRSMFRFPGECIGEFRKLPAHSNVQIIERSKQCRADIDILWQTAQRLHRGVSTRKQVETAYSDFESALQKAADELDTGEKLKSGWATELIANYTKSHHNWPAVSATLDKALQARKALVQLTSEQSVKVIEKKLFRFATPEDKSKY